MATTSFVDNSTLVPAAWLNDADAAGYQYLTSPAGTNTITATGPASMTAYATGQRLRFLPANTNTGATTIAITPSGGAALAARNIFWNGAALVGGELRINIPVEIMDDGTRFQIVGSASMVQVKGATLTANRVPYAVGAGSLVQDSVNLTFDGTTLTANTLTVSTGAFTVSGAGPHAIGGATTTRDQVAIEGTFAGPANDDTRGLSVLSTLTPAVNFSGYGFISQTTINKGGSGTHQDFVGALFVLPAIGAGAATLTNASTLKITGAPTVGTNKYAAWIIGQLRFDDNAANGTVATAMSSVGPVGSNTTIQEWLKVTIGANVRYIPCF